MPDSTSRKSSSTAGKRGRGRPDSSTSVGPDKLLTYARQHFARHGFEASSLRQIARDAKVDPALIAHHFGSKETLWAAVIEQIARQSAPLVEATERLGQSPLAPEQRIHKALTLLVDQVFENPDIGMFLSTAASEQSERLELLIDQLVRPYRNALVPLLVRAPARREQRDEAEVMFHMLVNAVSKTVAYSHVLRAFSTLPDSPSRFRRTVLKTALTLLGTA